MAGGAAGPLAEQMVDSQTGPATALSRAERREVVRAALGSLIPIDREILALLDFDGLNFAEIGAILGIKENTARPGSAIPMMLFLVFDVPSYLVQV